MLAVKKHILFKLFLIVVAAICWNNVIGQEVKKKVKPKLRLNYTKYMDGQMEVTANAYYKKDKKWIVCEGANVGFYLDDEFENLYFNAQVDDEGYATLAIGIDDARSFLDTAGYYRFYARLESDEMFKEREADIAVLNANLNVEFVTKDSIHMIEATLMCFNPDSNEMLPGYKKKLKFYVVRALSLLPITDKIKYTNKNGMANAEFPTNIPGDVEGNLTVSVRLEEEDDYGTVAYNGDINWGVPHIKEHKEKRSLAGGQKNAPIVIVIGISATLVAVWGYIAYIVFGLFQIQSLGKRDDDQFNY